MNIKTIVYVIGSIGALLFMCNYLPDVIKAINQGAGFVYLSGHGSPITWSTHPLDTEEEDDWIDGLYSSEMRRLTNCNKLPIVLVSGCHNSQFDVKSN